MDGFIFCFVPKIWWKACPCAVEYLAEASRSIRSRIDDFVAGYSGRETCMRVTSVFWIARYAFVFSGEKSAEKHRWIGRCFWMRNGHV